MSKRLPYPKFQGPSDTYWRSLREAADSPELHDALEREFPDGAAVPPDGVSRRDFFKYMGASMALAGVAACRRPDEKILPYAKQPEEVVPGVPLFFATAAAWNGTAVGLVVESHEGRPTKIEGNPKHPESLGSTNTYLQADVLNMYDPDRSTSPSEKGANRTWEDAATALGKLGAKHKAAGGKGLAILTEAHRSPTTARLLARLKSELPGVQIFRYEPWSRDNARAGAELAFGKVYESVYDLAKAKVVVTLDSDLLHSDGGGSIRHSRGFAASRTDKKPADMSRLYSVESSFSVTGAMADHRFAMTSRNVGAFAVALGRALDLGGLPSVDVPAAVAKKVAAVAKDVKAAAGAAVVVAGEKQPPAVHAIAALLNAGFGGKTVTFVEPFDAAPEGARSIMALAKAVGDKSVTSLVILGGNPVFDAPADANFAALLGGLETSVHLSSHRDETSAAATWHLNRAHMLESWSDLRSLDGTLSMVQPLIAPMFDGKTDAEVVAMLLGDPARAHDLLRATHAAAGEKAWRKALHDGLVDGSAYPAQSPKPAGADALAGAMKDALAPAAGYEVSFVPDSHAWDGRYANNAWTQENPDPMTKMVWGNAALISTGTAKELGVSDGDLVTVQAGGASVTLPALVAVGQADKSITLPFGNGRKVTGRIGTGAGVNVYPLRTSAAMNVGGAKVVKAGGTDEIVRTQEHFLMERRWPVRAATATQYDKDPEYFNGKVLEQGERETGRFAEGHPKLLSLFPDYDYTKGHRWAMAIDLNTCIGCGACTVACQAENNILVVGKDGVRRTREMHWIRVDRYFRGDPAEPESVTQPVPCQQCENAPCEQVCPVGATSHSPEGLNDMAYNRCIGTRYCLNNCPFKVRRFNFFNYQKKSVEADGDAGLPPLRQAQFNPDVTIRSRGVMEKCTYCVQRINEAKIDSHKRGTEEVVDGTIKTACEQTCPTAAITFGDLNDPKSRVTALKNQKRSYVLLEELNVRPRTTYLARLSNPNPEIA